MGLDIRICRLKKRYCPHCGEQLQSEVVWCEDSGGRVWTPFLKKVGYYVDYENRTEENDWYGKDMVLTDEQRKELYDFVVNEKPYNSDLIEATVGCAIASGDEVLINADW